jgi:hypothetical protein
MHLLSDLHLQTQENTEIFHVAFLKNQKGELAVCQVSDSICQYGDHLKVGASLVAQRITKPQH